MKIINAFLVVKTSTVTFSAANAADVLFAENSEMPKVVHI